MISPADYEFLQLFLRQRMGYDLRDGRQDLVVHRLGPVAASLQLEHVGELLARVRAGDPLLGAVVVDAMTNSETYFFRGKCFDHLRAIILPDVVAARASTKQLRIWCGACSTGQEPYCVAITLADHFSQLQDWSIDILATDISETALKRARDGSYSQFEVQRGMPVRTLLKHFVQQGHRWHIRENLRRYVRFQQFNLLDDFAAIGGPFDIILIRNVLIYFELPVKKAIFAKLRRVITPDGYLILGESETIFGLTDQFTIAQAGYDFYRPA